VVSYADLGGLGAREGTPVVHTWEPPPPTPQELPVAALGSFRLFVWLLILLPLFLFRSNRSPKIWWVWLPVLIGGIEGIIIARLITGGDRITPQAACSFVVGLAAMWLLIPFLESRNRLLSFLKALLTLAGVSLLAFLPTLLATYGGWLDFRPYLAALLALASLAVTFGLSLSSLALRRRFGRARFLLWLAVWTVLAWVAIATPFVIVGSLTSNIEWGATVLGLLCLSAISLALVLPLVLLSFWQPFFRARFVGFLKMPQTDPPAETTMPPRLPGVDLVGKPTTTLPGGE
jgi:hypothetical protein